MLFESFSKKAWFSLILLALPMLLVMTTMTIRGTAQTSRSIIYYGDINCHYCHESQAIIQDFSQQHPDVQITYYMLDLNNQTNLDFLKSALLSYNVSKMQVPAAVLNSTGIISVIFYEDITLDNLNYWYTKGYLPGSESSMDITSWVAFVSGLIVGASPCVLLILSIFGTSITLEAKSKKYLSIAGGFIVGVLLAYLVISVIFIWLLPLIDLINNIRIIFGIILLIIGLWQIIDMKNEKSHIFGTPKAIQKILKDLFSRKSGISALVLGFLFALIKIPCFGGIYLSILYSTRDSPVLFVNVALYLLGMVLPIIGVFIALRFGLMSKSINTFRQENRPLLRLLSGILLITLTIYLFLGNLEDYLLLLIIIVFEVGIVFLLIYFKHINQEPNTKLSPEANQESQNDSSHDVVKDLN